MSTQTLSVALKCRHTKNYNSLSLNAVKLEDLPLYRTIGNSSPHSLNQTLFLAAGTVHLLDNAGSFSPEYSRISAPPSAWAAGSPEDWTAPPSSRRGGPVANRGRPSLGPDCSDPIPDCPDQTPDCSDPVAVVKSVPTAARRKSVSL